MLISAVALATPQLKYVYAGASPTIVFIHGKADCSTTMTDCYSGDSTTGPVGYWTNDSYGNTQIDEMTRYYTASGTYTRHEAFAIGYDLDNQALWYAANDVGSCLSDLMNGTNSSGCNPSKYQRTNFIIVTHSAGATVVDRLLSTGWFSGGTNSWPSHVPWVISLAPALVGSRSSSALYGVDGYGNFCTSFVSWVAGATLKDNGAASLTRGTVIGQANVGYAGRSPVNLYKVTTTGGSASANNAGCIPVFGCGWSSGSINVNEHDNDEDMGLLAGCEGYGSSDDMDGLLYWSDSDPTGNSTPSNGAGCNTYDTAYGNGVTSCHYYSQYSGNYIHWFTSWANHSHSRDDAYTSEGDWQSIYGCYFRSPGTCVGQYGL
jgi:hypothetical protein